MERLNYFNPYGSKKELSENDLTRSFLVLLRYSFSALSVFYDYCRMQLNKNNKDLGLPFLNTIIYNEIEFETQRGNINIETNEILSILITDEHLKLTQHTEFDESRRAVYDGIIKFGKDITFLIENKPRSKNVWEGQLKPSIKYVAKETKLLKGQPILEWKEIIKFLTKLLKAETLSGQEKLLISDFLTFIDFNFSYLNPFDKFDLCKNDKELLQRRIKNLLESISVSTDLVNTIPVGVIILN